MTSVKKTITCGGLFAGIGGFCLGFEKAGFKTLWGTDLSKDSARAYKNNIKNTEYLVADIKELKANIDLKPVDVLHAGFPCQSFSSAGKRLGFEDPRGKLFFEIIRLLNEWGSSKPKILVLENSPHLKDGEGGLWFRTIQTEIQRSGYWFGASSSFILDTRENGGLPQRRKRLFMIAVNQDFFDFNPFNLKDVAPKRTISLEEIIKFNEQNYYYYLHGDNRYAHMIQKQLNDAEPYQLYQLRKYLVRVPEVGVCPTLTANMGKGGHNVPFILDGKRLRKLTERECLDLQGFPENFQFPEGLSSAKKYEMIGNSVSPLISSVIAEETKRLIIEREYERKNEVVV
jgi:DNA (cytosine-5)-methyltransferase 1